MAESAVRGRDFVILLLLFVVLHHCWYEQIKYNFLLEPVWFVENPVSRIVKNGKQMLDLVPPAVLDLNSDGKLEMIAIVKTSNEVDDQMVVEDNALYVLQVLDIGETAVIAVDEVFHPPILQGILLAGSQLNAPEVLAAGPTAPGQGFIAVAFANLTIAGFHLSKDTDGSSHQMKQLWLKDLVNISTELSSVLTKRDRDVSHGCHRVVRLQYFNPNKITHEHSQETDDEDILLVSITRSAAPAPLLPPASVNNATSAATGCQHAAPLAIILALQPSTAQLLWVHRNEELGDSSLSASLPSSTGFTLDLRKVLLEKQIGAGKDWSLFRNSFLKLLPKLGHWFGEEDERLVTGTFTRGRLGGVRPHLKQAPNTAKNTNKNSKQTTTTTTITTKSNGKATSDKGLNKKQKEQKKLILEESNDKNSKKNKAKLLQFGLPKAAHNKQRRNNNNKVNPEQLSTLTNRSSVMTKEEPKGAVKAAVNHHFHNRHHYHRQHNVAILRHARGLTAVTLQTGVHLATLVLSPHLVYGDIDGDRHIDSFHFLPDDVSSPAYGEAPCWGAVLSGLPPTAQLFNTSALCGAGMQSRRNAVGLNGGGEHIPQNRVTGRRRQHPKYRRNRSQRNNTSSTSFANVEEVGYAPPLLLSPASRYEDIAAIVFSSVGVLSAVDRRGDVKWQDFTIAQPFNIHATDHFQPKIAMFRPLSLHDHHVEDGEVNGHFDDENDPIAVLLSQEKSLSLFTLQGNYLISVGVPSPLVSAPILDYDFDGDGVRDLIVPTEGALIGYRTVLTPQFYPLFLPLLVLLIIAVLVFISRLQWDQDRTVSGARQQGLNRAKKDMAGWIKAIRSTRSTDALHLD